MKNNTVILAPHSYVVVHRKQPSIYDVYEIETGEWVSFRLLKQKGKQIFQTEQSVTF